ncbi:dUTP diphosphatase [bacterium]|nr:dUTP diphosphatase [bacterium]
MEEKIKIKISFTPDRKEDVPLPKYMTEGSSGLDLCADVDDFLTINSQEVVGIPTGLRLEIPQGYEGQIRPRSGLAAKFGVTVINTPGTIDSDYRGEIKVLLINMSTVPFIVHRGDRIAQIVFSPVIRAELDFSEQLDNTKRGDGGFGHTGTK